MKILIISLLVVLLGVGGFLVFKSQKVTKTATMMPELAGNPRLKYGAISCGASGCSLTIEFNVPEVCHLGDYNFMRVDLNKASSKPNFLLSIEPMSPVDSSVPPFSQEFTLKALQTGLKTTLHFPKYKKPIPFGVFVCKDARAEKRCSEKQYMDLDEMMSSNFSAFAANPAYRSPDRIYFFQFLLWESENRLVAMDDQDPMLLTDSLYALRLQYLNQRAPTSENSTLMDKVKGLSQTLRSVPLDFGADSKIVITLPRYNQKNCPQ